MLAPPSFVCCPARKRCPACLSNSLVSGVLSPRCSGSACRMSVRAASPHAPGPTALDTFSGWHEWHAVTRAGPGARSDPPMLPKTLRTRPTVASAGNENPA
jgi:hypothetical protein